MFMLTHCSLIAGQSRPSYASNSGYHSYGPWKLREATGFGLYRKHVAARSSKSLVVATSQDWWEDELEYDAITDYLKPKNLVIVATPEGALNQEGALQALRASLQRLVFNTAVSSEQALHFAQQLWAGRDGPPYFHKVRKRSALDTAATEPAASEDLLQELLGQNWRVDLDYGLGVEIPEHETLLIVCSAQAAQQLLRSAGVGTSNNSSSEVAPGGVVVLHAPGHKGGDPAAAGDRGLQLVASVSGFEGDRDLHELIVSQN